jgi:alcohol dehydrogenase class IV
VQCEPVIALAESVDPAGRAAALEGFDGVLGLGGRTALSAALRRAAPGARVGAAGLPVLAVPTTIGCVGIAPMPPGPVRGGGCARLPAVVLCDPTLTLLAGPAETAAAGMDALVHCIETYLATAWNPPADGMALEGVRRAGLWLRRAVEEPGNLEARREMLAVALNGALAGQKGLGAVHALAHALEEELSRPAARAPAHGALHPALLAPVLRFNAPAVGERFPALAQALGRPSAAAPGTGDLAAALAALARSIGLPAALDGLALDAAARGRVAATAAEDAANRTNPRHATAADYRDMLAEAG